MTDPKFLEIAETCGFDISQYNPEEDLDGLPMGFIEDFYNAVVVHCAKIVNLHKQGSERHDDGVVYYYDVDVGTNLLRQREYNKKK